ncbi:MAG TPA: hypothetical protein VGK19_00685 [Capsulimonadaceae bacterium]|jgi:hypothetical protein
MKETPTHTNKLDAVTDFLNTPLFTLPERRKSPYRVLFLDEVAVRASVAGITASAIIAFALVVAALMPHPYSWGRGLGEALFAIPALGSLMTIHCLLFAFALTAMERSQWKMTRRSLILMSLFLAAAYEAAICALMVGTGLWFAHGGWGPTSGFTGDARVATVSIVATAYGGYVTGKRYSTAAIDDIAFDSRRDIVLVRIWIVVAAVVAWGAFAPCWVR